MFSPPELGFPEKFQTFRPAQEEAIHHVLTSEKRFVGIGAPPGVGKTAVAFALAKLLGGRTVILTANLGLERQYLSELGSAGLVGMRGRANYACWEGGSCEDGVRWGCRDRAGCPYTSDLRAFNAASVGVTNYAWWMSAPKIEEADTLVCDECTQASEWLSRALDYRITERECREVGAKLAPVPGESHEEWKALARLLRERSNSRITVLKAKLSDARGSTRERLGRDLKAAERLHENAGKLNGLDANWVVTADEGSDEGRAWRFECVWPGQFREKLFRFTPRVVLLSATLRPKTLELLGIKRADCDFREWPRQFPPANGPVLWVPTARVKHSMSTEDEQRWLRRIREVSDWGSSRRGLVHTVSYDRAKQIASTLDPARVVLNGRADPESLTARRAYDKFVNGPDSGVLVSPSFSTGWDFKGRRGEWQVIAKIAFPDTRSKLMQVRTDKDPSYPMYLAAQELVQGSGRITRSEQDRGVTLVVDDQIEWFQRRASEYVPRWFRVRRETELPKLLSRAVD